MQSSTTEATTQAIKLKKEKVIKGITCPSCGGSLDLKEGMKVFNCQYCGTLLKARGDAGILKYYVPKKLKRDDAIKRTFNWLEEGISKAKDLKSQAKVEDAFLVYIPFWRLRADVVGWVFGQKKQTSNNRTTYVDKEVKIQNSFDTTVAACDTAELGVKKVNLAGDEIKPVNFEELQLDGMLFNIVSSEKEITEKTFENFKAQARAMGNLDRITFAKYDMVRDSVSIVYYPLWVVRYNYKNRTYQVVIDGEDGSVTYGKAPGSNLFRAITGILGTAAGMFLATFFEVFLIFSKPDKGTVAVYVFCLIAGIFIMRWAYKKFRYGGEIEEGTGLVKEQPQNLVSKYGFTVTDKTAATMDTAKNVLGAVAVGGILGSILNSTKD